MRGFGYLAVLVGAVGGLAGGLSTPATALQASPVEELYAELVDASTFDVCWADEDFRARPWTLTVARGRRPARRAARLVARVPAGSDDCYEVDGLAFGVPYTFTIVVHLKGGGRSAPASVTAATRRPGQFVWTRSRTRRAPRAPGADGRVVVAAAESRPEVAALFWRPRRDDEQLFIATLSPAGAWSPASQITDDDAPFNVPLIAGNARGDLAVSWQSPAYEPDLYRLRPAGSRRWSAPRAPVGAAPPDRRGLIPGDGIQALVLDAAGSLHMLVIHGYDEARYITNATGRWTSSLIPPPWCSDVGGGCSRFPPDLPLMTYDPLTNRLVLAEHHFETRVIDGRSQRASVLTIADKPAAALAFGPAHEALAATGRYEIAANLAVRARRSDQHRPDPVGQLPRPARHDGR